MDTFEQALDSGQVKEDEEDNVTLAHDDGDEHGAIASVVTSQGTLAIDPSIQYQLRADTGHSGQVTYRVVQVTQTEDGQAQVVAGLPNQLAQNMVQNPQSQSNNFETAVMQSPFSNGDSPSPDTLATTSDGRFTFVPGAGGDGQVEALGGAGFSQVSTASDSQGQLYVMMSPQDVLQAGNQRSIAPRTGLTPRIEGGRSTRDDRRRATHNEVERRRRDKINNWIVQLSKLIPECSAEQTKAGQIGVLTLASKGGILSKACEYIAELRNTNLRLAEHLKETERLAVDAEITRQQCEELKQENAMLRAQLQQHGIVPPDLTGNGS